jgi:mRNA interferase RelE/StbE
MKYTIAIKPRAMKDLQDVPVRDAERILDKIEAMSDNLQGDVKHLTNYTPEYRLRVGRWRVLFEIEQNNSIVIYRIKPRGEAYT